LRISSVSVQSILKDNFNMYQDCHQIHTLPAEGGTEGEWCEHVTGPSAEA
jgi:hypothetical protein